MRREFLATNMNIVRLLTVFLDADLLLVHIVNDLRGVFPSALCLESASSCMRRHQIDGLIRELILMMIKGGRKAYEYSLKQAGSQSVLTPIACLMEEEGVRIAALLISSLTRLRNSERRPSPSFSFSLKTN